MKTNTANYNERAVIKLHQDVLEAFNAGDMDKLLSLHADNIILMEPNMPAIHGRQEVIRLFEKFQEQKVQLKLSFKILELEVFGERAFLRGEVIKTTMQQDKAPETDTGKFISLSQKQKDGTWLRTHVIVNSDAASAATPPAGKTVAFKTGRVSMGVHDRLWR